jgi:hypothetical protein
MENPEDSEYLLDISISVENDSLNIDVSRTLPSESTRVSIRGWSGTPILNEIKFGDRLYRPVSEIIDEPTSMTWRQRWQRWMMSIPWIG